MDKLNAPDEIQEIKDLVISYAKQETLEPFRFLQKYLAWGFAGAVCAVLGISFFALGVLRLTQSFEMFAGSSWASLVPYVAAIAFCLGCIGWLGIIMSRAKSRVR